MTSVPQRSNPTREGRGSDLLDGRGGSNTVNASSLNNVISLKMLRQILPRRLAIVRFSIRASHPVVLFAWVNSILSLIHERGCHPVDQPHLR